MVPTQLGLSGRLDPAEGEDRTCASAWQLRLPSSAARVPPPTSTPACPLESQILQSVALASVINAAPSRQQLALPLGLFGVHLFLGNWWNVSRTSSDAALLSLRLLCVHCRRCARQHMH